MHRAAVFAGHKGSVYALAPAAGDGEFLSGSGDGLVVRWRLGKPAQGHAVADAGNAVFSLCTAPNGRHLLIGTGSGVLMQAHVDATREPRSFDVHRKGIFRIVPIPGDRFACAGGDGTLSIWSMRTAGLELVRHFPLGDSKLRDLAPSPDGARIAVACGDGRVRVLDTELFNEQATIEAHGTAEQDGGPHGATAVAWHPRKPVLLSGGKDGHLRAWHATDRFRCIQALAAHKGGIYRIAFDAQGARLATASRDKTAKLWDARSLDPLARLDLPAGGHTHSVNDALWCGGALITCSDDRRIVAWTELP